MGKEFGKYLKQLREDRGMTLRDVEEMVKISNAYLSQVENGQRSVPTMKILSKLAQAYGVSVTVLAEQAAAEIRNQKIESETNPPPDTEFVSRGYEHLTEENKNKLKSFLNYLQSQQKGK
jgi:transcriptional regulator with XRE-family HTH domain